MSQEQQRKNVKNISSPTENAELIFQTLKYNLISGETVPLSGKTKYIFMR